MTKAEIVASLKEQAIDKDYQADGDEDSIFADDAQALREAAEMLEKSEAVKHGRRTEGMMPTDHKRTYSQRGDDYLLEAWKVCEKEKPAPRCPYCGTPMVGEEKIEGAYWYECYKCGATAPTEETEQAAYTAAMQRYVEPNHPLTLEAAKEQRVVWMEKHLCEPVPVIFYVDAFPHQSVFVGVFGVGEDEYFDNNVWYNNEDYGVEWRCWLRKPTQEEMSTTPWREK